MDIATLATFAASIPYPLVVTDSSLYVLAANEPGMAMLGGELASEPQQPATLLSNLPDSERDQFSAAIETLEALGQSAAPHSVAVEVERLTPHGSGRCHVMISAWHEASSGERGFAFTSRDFGAFPDPQQKVERDAARMEVARQLAATMNHEVNNPLFVVSATLEDLLAEIDDPAEQRRLNAALDAVWRVSSAVKKLSEIRQLVTTAYIEGFPMIDLEASQAHPEECTSDNG